MDRSPVRGVARLAAILDSLPEALLLIDAGGRVVNANAVALAWFEGGGVPLVGRPITEFLSGFGTAVARVGDGGVWTDGGYEPSGSGGSGASDGPERMVAKTAAGSAFPAEIVRSFLPAAHGGLEVVCVRNVSGVADAEQELRRQQRQTELILRATSEGIVGVDTGGRVVLVNPAAARILKYRASELGGLEFATLISGESPVSDTLRTGRKHRLGVEAGIVLTAKDGTRVPVELSTAPVLEGEALVGAVVTFVDVSRFRLPVLANGAAGQGAAGRSLSDTQGGGGALNADSVSALRRPLDAARNELARLTDGGDGLGSAARHHLAHVTAELAEAARLVDDLLDAATGLSGLRKRPAELGRIVHAAVDAATDLAAAAGIDLAVHTGPAEVVIDAERLTQALRHLLVDTVQASPHGSTVVVAAARRGAIARIEIRGVEIGSVPEHLGFARVVVERHGGQLSAHRVEGKGVTYVIELPAGDPRDGELTNGSAAALGPGTSMSRPLVEETRIIPIVRDTDVAQPGIGSRGGSGARQIGAGPSAAPAAPTSPQLPGIPRQADPTDERWFDGVRGYAATALGERGGEPDSDAAPSPRGRRRAAGQGLPTGQAPAQPQAQAQGAGFGGYPTTDTDDRYLIQQVQPYEADATWGEQADDARGATAGGTHSAAFGGPAGRSEQGALSQAYGAQSAGAASADEGPYGGRGFGGSVGRSGQNELSQPYGPQSDQADEGPYGGAGFGGAAGRSGLNAAGQPYGPQPDSADQAGYDGPGFGGPAGRSEQGALGQPHGPQSAEAAYGGSGSGFGAPVGQSPQSTLSQAYGSQSAGVASAGHAAHAAHAAAGRSEPRAWPNPDEPDPEPVGPDDPFGWAAAQAGAPEPEPAVQPTLLIWPTPEPNAAELLFAQGYAPTALKAPDQLAETGPRRPVALLADPVGVPVTRAALHTLRAAAADSGIPLFVTAGLGAVPAAALVATARRGADPSALLRALTPEQVPAPRVLLIEENPDLAAAFAISLERDGMRVVQAASENDAMTALSAEHPHLVVMNLTLVRRRRSGVVDWLRAYERLHLAPTVLYTAPAALTGDLDLMRALRSGAAAVHLTDRETGSEAAARLLDLMGKVAD